MLFRLQGCLIRLGSIHVEYWEKALRSLLWAKGLLGQNLASDDLYQNVTLRAPDVMGFKTEIPGMNLPAEASEHRSP